MRSGAGSGTPWSGPVASVAGRLCRYHGGSGWLAPMSGHDAITPQTFALHAFRCWVPYETWPC
jgi:hypothetical protein